MSRFGFDCDNADAMNVNFIDIPTLFQQEEERILGASMESVFCGKVLKIRLVLKRLVHDGDLAVPRGAADDRKQLGDEIVARKTFRLVGKMLVEE